MFELLPWDFLTFHVPDTNNNVLTGMMDESGDMEIEDDGDDEETPESRRKILTWL